MFISVLICSDDRAGRLGPMLESLLTPSNLQADDWEVMVVTDYDCRDGADKVCAEFQARFPTHFRHLVQQNTGKSNGMNLAIEQARGEVLALTDDDVLCAPNYVQGVRTVFSTYDVEGAQGRVHLDCEGGWPPHMHGDLAQFMSYREYGDEVLAWHGNLTGTNMIVRAETLRRVGGYSPVLGAGSTGFAEDTELSWRIRRSGARLVYAPQILVRHQLPKNRLTKTFFLERYFRNGKSQAYCEELSVPMWRFAAYVAKVTLRGELEAALLRLQGRPADALRRRCEVREKIGFAWQHYKFRSGRATRVAVGQPEPGGSPVATAVPAEWSRETVRTHTV
jgi:glucosyl-dolichyl phosphate glucuronosyltransferase